MFDIGWTELLVIGIVALIVVGPKDLPGMFRTLGRFTGKAKAMARDFQRAMDQAADEAGVKDIKDMGADLRRATDPKAMGMDALKDATTGWTSDMPKPDSMGAETTKLAAERAEAAKKIREKAAEKATERLEAAEAAKAAANSVADTAPASASEAQVKKPAAKKAAPKKPAAKKPPAKPAPAKKPAVKAAARKPAVKAAAKAKDKDSAS